MKTENIWIVDNDIRYIEHYNSAFESHYNMRVFNSFETFLRAYQSATEKESPNVLISELDLPDQSFLTFIEEQSNTLKDLPIIIVSSSTDLNLLRQCFVKSVVDIIFKPSSRNELIVKVDHVLQEHSFKKRVHFDPINSTVTVKGVQTQTLTKKEFQILLVLISSKKGSISRKMIVDKVWKGIKVSRKSLDVHICNLRKKIRDAGIYIYSIKPNEYTISIDEMKSNFHKNIMLDQETTVC